MQNGIIEIIVVFLVLVDRKSLDRIQYPPSLEGVEGNNNKNNGEHLYSAFTGSSACSMSFTIHYYPSMPYFNPEPSQHSQEAYSMAAC